MVLLENFFTDIISPLDQFEIRDLINLEILGGNIHLSLTNIGFYLTLSSLIILILKCLKLVF